MDNKEKLSDRQLALALAVEKAAGEGHAVVTQNVIFDADKFYRWLKGI